MRKSIGRVFLAGLVFLLLVPASQVWGYRGGRSARGGGTMGHHGQLKSSGVRGGSRLHRQNRTIHGRHPRPGPSLQHFRSTTTRTGSAPHHGFRKGRPRKIPKRIWEPVRWVESEQGIVILNTEVSTASGDPPQRPPKAAPSDANKVWVPGKWIEGDHGVLIWQTGHWKISSSDR